MKRIVTGIQPSGTPHLGNYFGLIAPSLDLARNASAIYFIADYHALTTVRDPARLRRSTLDVAATWLALGLDPADTILYRQSDLPEVCELAWLLGCVAAKGLLNRGHAYKSATEANRDAGRPIDDGVSGGIFNYPLLMAADILIHDADLVPVGQDQQQHIEVTRDTAQAFNAAYGRTFTVPDGVIDQNVASIPGTDGRKMSKSHDNVVPIFAERAEVTRRIMSVVTDSRRPDEPKEPESCNVFRLYRHVAPPAAVAELAEQYRSGTIGYRQAKELLIEAHQQRFGSAAEQFEAIRSDLGTIEQILASGAEQARASAARQLAAAREAVGLGPTIASAVRSPATRSPLTASGSSIRSEPGTPGTSSPRGIQ